MSMSRVHTTLHLNNESTQHHMLKQEEVNALAQEVQPEGGVILPPEQVAKLLMLDGHCECGPEWFCLLHEACFIHKLCFCEGSGAWPPYQPPCDWTAYLHAWLADMMSHPIV
jgi:hypothetical protein